MLRHAFIFAALLSSQGAHAYAPEVLLQKSLSRVPELDSPSSRQFLNPFSEIKIGGERSWGNSQGLIGKDDNGRIRTRDQEEKGHQLSLEVAPKGLSESISYYKYEKSLGARTALERKILQSKSARAAYELLARAAQAKEEKSLLAEWNTVLERSQRLSAITARSEGDAKAVLKAAGEIDKAKNEMAEVNSVMAGVSFLLKNRGLSLDELETDQMLSAAEIGERLKGMNELSSLTGQDAEAELKLETARFKYASDKNSKWIDSLKFSVSKGEDSIIRKRFVPLENTTLPAGSILTQDESRKGTSYSIGLTINLPFLAASDLDEQRDRIRLARREVESQVEANEANERTAALREVVKEKIAAYVNATESKANITDSLLRNDPALAMELQRASMNKRLFRIKLLGEIRLLYVEFLYEMGLLADESNLHQLSKKAGA